jgi:hypothetical protein
MQGLSHPLKPTAFVGLRLRPMVQSHHTSCEGFSARREAKAPALSASSPNGQSMPVKPCECGSMFTRVTIFSISGGGSLSAEANIVRAVEVCPLPCAISRLWP